VLLLLAKQIAYMCVFGGAAQTMKILTYRAVLFCFSANSTNFMSYTSRSLLVFFTIDLSDFSVRFY
jgi:hypothetical protein